MTNIEKMRWKNGGAIQKAKMWRQKRSEKNFAAN
jgi:hypothetical protein